MGTLLEEKDAIRELMHAYCFRCDTRDADGLAALFTEDCVWDGGPFGRKNGPEELKQFLLASVGAQHRIRHITANEIISVDGDSASASCYFVVLRLGEGRPETYFTGFYDDKFVKRGGKWLFRERITRDA
jgi:ketosteroid isomerase-like protein